MSLLTLEAKLERQEPTTPWGFRMQGGKDFSSPLTIARVTPKSLADKCGLMQGDIILKIGNKSSDTLKHKDAQDAIVSYGNKLDLLLQRIREKKNMQNGFGGGAPTYQTFSTPTISSYQSPASNPGQGTSTYNAAPKPFGASVPSNPAPAPYKTSAEINLSQQNLNIGSSSPASYSKYADIDDKPNQSTQSRSFKFLQDTLASGQVLARESITEPPSALRPTVDLRRSPSPNAGVNKQFNSPKSLYSNTNAQKQQTLTVNENKNGSCDTEEDVPKYDAQGKRVYRPSETFKLIQEQENVAEKPKDEPVAPLQTRTIKILEKQLEGTVIRQTGTNSVNVDDTGTLVNSKETKVSTGDIQVYYPSETFRLVQKNEHKVHRTEVHVPEQSRTFKEIHNQLIGEQHAPPPPAPVQPRAPPAAPKPGVWAPGQPSGGAPAAKPFVPSVAPPAPAAPRTAPPKPSGVGAMRGKIGDAVIKSDATRIPICASCGNSIRGPFVTATGKCWCPDHFVCANPRCGTKLIDIGFVEEGGFLYCERDYELYFAPHCNKCDAAIVGECVNALNKQYHPACFLCHQCKKPIGGNQFHLEEGNAYCEDDWRQMFQTMCNACDFPIEPGDKWVEALSQNYHSECFNCSTCQINLEGQAFYAKNGKPFCKKHAR